MRLQGCDSQRRIELRDGSFLFGMFLCVCFTEEVIHNLPVDKGTTTMIKVRLLVTNLALFEPHAYRDIITYFSPVTLNVAESRLYKFWKIDIQYIRPDTHNRPVLLVKLLIYQMNASSRVVPGSPQVRVLWSFVVRDVAMMRGEMLHLLAKNGPGYFLTGETSWPRRLQRAMKNGGRKRSDNHGGALAAAPKMPLDCVD